MPHRKLGLGKPTGLTQPEEAYLLAQIAAGKGPRFIILTHFPPVKAKLAVGQTAQGAISASEGTNQNC